MRTFDRPIDRPNADLFSLFSWNIKIWIGAIKMNLNLKERDGGGNKYWDKALKIHYLRLELLEDLKQSWRTLEQKMNILWGKD